MGNGEKPFLCWEEGGVFIPFRLDSLEKETSLARKSQWRMYQRSLTQAAQHLNTARESHRLLFGEENEALLNAIMTISIEFERTGQPK